jgi:hypothetical protein
MLFIKNGKALLQLFLKFVLIVLVRNADNKNGKEASIIRGKKTAKLYLTSSRKYVRLLLSTGKQVGIASRVFPVNFIPLNGSVPRWPSGLNFRECPSHGI